MLKRTSVAALSVLLRNTKGTMEQAPFLYSLHTYAQCVVNGAIVCRFAFSVVFSIDHSSCAGVEFNNTTVRAYVVVQESLHILTHSTRRFLVLCQFRPEETFTVKAG